MLGITTADTFRFVWGPDAGHEDRPEWLPVSEATEEATVFEVRGLGPLEYPKLERPDPEPAPAEGEERAPMSRAKMDEWMEFHVDVLRLGVVSIMEGETRATVEQFVGAPVGLVSESMIFTLSAKVLELSQGKPGPT